jgi:hypothetical protein
MNDNQIILFMLIAHSLIITTNTTESYQINCMIEKLIIFLCCIS